MVDTTKTSDDVTSKNKMRYKKQKQWLWFIFLWFCGLGSAALISFLIKLVMRSDFVGLA
ncbi:MAG: hypothetical protein Tsb006_4220 [Rickettsiaceae bacterium]